MIYGRLRTLGRASVPREAHERYPAFKAARDKADDELMALLLAIEEQTGSTPVMGEQGESDSLPTDLAETKIWLDLKRLAAWAEKGELPEGRRTTLDPADDPKLAPYLDGTQEPERFSHFLRHAEASGYYVPLAFPRPFWLPEQQLSVGSAQMLIAELDELGTRLRPRKSEFTDEWTLLGRLHELAERAVARNLTLELSTTPFGDVSEQ